MNFTKSIQIGTTFIVGIINLLFILLIVKFSLNFPFYDDFDAIGSYILKASKSNIFQQFLYLFDQYAEHRLGFTRFVSLLYYHIFHSINFQHLQIFGLLGLIGIQFVIYKHVIKSNKSILITIITSIILLNFQYYENLISAMTSIQNLFVPFFALATFYFLATKSSKWTYYTLSLLAVMTSGNGILLFPIIFFYLLWTKQSIREILIWLFYSICIIYLYFLHYEKPETGFGGRTEIFETLKHPWSFIENILLFSAACFKPFNFDTISIKCLGAAIILLFVYFLIDLIRAKEKNHQKIWLGLCIVFLVGTSLLVALNRGYSSENMFISRYKIYSTLNLIFVVLIVNQLYSKFYLNTIFFLFAICFSFVSFSHLNNIVLEYHHFNYASATFHLNNKKWKGLYPPYTSQFMNAEIANKISEQLESAHIYNVPRPVNIISNYLDSKKLPFTKNIQFEKTEYPDNLVLNFNEKFNNSTNTNFISVESKNQVILIPINVNLSNINLIKHALNFETSATNSYVIIPKINIDHGNYAIWGHFNLDHSVRKYHIMNYQVPKISNQSYHN